MGGRNTPDSGACDDEFLVGADDAHADSTGVRRNQRLVLRVSRLIYLNAKEAESLADACANHWRIFTDTAGEDERVQSDKRRGEGANPLFSDSRIAPRLPLPARHRLPERTIPSGRN